MPQYVGEFESACPHYHSHPPWSRKARKMVETSDWTVYKQK